MIHDFGYILFLLLFGHGVADYPLQGSFLSNAKRRNNPLGANGAWMMFLTTHGVIHGGFVLYFTGSINLGIGEIIAHFLIDFMKCENKIDTYVDQALHVLCKILWAAIAVRMI